MVRDDDGAPFEVKEKPTWEGERVSAFLRAAEPLATAGRFEGMGRCVPVCMYEQTSSPQRNRVALLSGAVRKLLAFALSIRLIAA